MSHDMYSSPLASRYASDYMLHLFSDDSRYQTWRRLWTALARAQCQLGLPITEAQVAVSPGLGFGAYGDEYVRFALIENDHRTRQAVRNIRRLLGGSSD